MCEQRMLVALLLLMVVAVGTHAQWGAESSAVVEVTSWTFNQEVLSSDMLVMVEFYKPGCGYCQSVWAQATAQLRGKVKLVAVNAAVYTTLSRRYQVQSYPSIKVFPAGKKTGASSDYTGRRTVSDIVAWASAKINTNVGPSEVSEVAPSELLKREFQLYDLSGWQGVSFSMMVAVKDTLKINYGSEAALQTRFNTADRDGNGRVDLNEWQIYGKHVKATQVIRPVFLGFDMNRDNFVSQLEVTKTWTNIFNNYLQRRNGHMPEWQKHLNNTVRRSMEADRNGDGKLSYEEFLTPW